jgi:hypothetical protein
MRWAKRATEVCSAWALNQLAHRCMLYMNGEATERGDWSGEHHRAYYAELKGGGGAAEAGETASSRPKRTGRRL